MRWYISAMLWACVNDDEAVAFELAEFGFILAEVVPFAGTRFGSDGAYRGELVVNFALVGSKLSFSKYLGAG
jgi:hypothetical protein